MNDGDYELAAILATPDPGSLYAGLSVLVSTAVEGDRCAALAAFGALEQLSAATAGGDDLDRSLDELRRTALELESLTIWACAASVRSVRTDLPVMSTPRFLRETAGARRFIHV